MSRTRMDKLRTKIKPEFSAGTTASFEAAATVVLGQLQEVFAGLLSALPTPPSTCTEVEDAFGIDPKLSWQVFRIATATNPLTVGMSVPARVSVQRLLKAAAKRGIAAEVIDPVESAFDDFERFVGEYAEDRGVLEAMLTAHVPKAREKAELASKQSAFKAMSHIRGMTMDAVVQTFFRSPSPGGSGVEMASLETYLGVRRLLPDARVGFVSAVVGQPTDRVLTLAGRPVEGPQSILLPAFSSTPLPEIRVETIEDVTHYWVVGRDVGLRGAVDLVSAWKHEGRGRRFALPGQPARAGVVCAIETPVKRLTCDVFFHRDLYTDSVPELLIYQLGVHGHVRFFGDPSREADRIQMQEHIRPLGTGLAGVRLSHVPAYPVMLEQVYADLGWDPAAFRGYRLDVEYPVCGAQYTVGFELPRAGGASDG